MLSAGLDDGERAPRAAGQSLGFFWDLGMWVAGLPHRDVTVVISTPTLRMLPVVLCAGFFDRSLKAATEKLPPEGALIWVPVKGQRWMIAQVESNTLVSGHPVLLARILGSPSTRLKVNAWLPAPGARGPATRRVRIESVHASVFGPERAGAIGLLPEPRCLLVGRKEELLADLSEDISFIPESVAPVTGSIGSLLAVETQGMMGYAHTRIVSAGVDTMTADPRWAIPDLVILAGARASLRWATRIRAQRMVLILERSARGFDESIRQLPELLRHSDTVEIPGAVLDRMPAAIEACAWSRE